MVNRKRKYNTNLIKRTVSYSTNEICSLFGIHKRTVHQWYKDGLQRIDDRKPYLVHGSELKRFLKARNNKRKQKCAVNELYCCKCRKPQKSWEGLVDIKVLNNKSVLIMGICEVCGTKINKLFSVKNLDRVQDYFVISTIHNEDLLESEQSIVNTDIK